MVKRSSARILPQAREQLPPESEQAPAARLFSPSVDKAWPELPYSSNVLR
jgi:hypothetical protein